jgi:hypothetical protein
MTRSDALCAGIVPSRDTVTGPADDHRLQEHYLVQHQYAPLGDFGCWGVLLSPSAAWTGTPWSPSTKAGFAEQ